MEKNQDPQLTPEELLRLQQLAKEGFNFTPQMLRNLTPEISVNPIINNLAESTFDSLGVILGKEGKPFSAIQVKNPFFADAGMKPENLDFTPVWQQKNLKLSINEVKGFLSFATHGLEAQLKPFIKQELKSYDVEDLLCIFYAKWLAQRDDSYLHHSHVKRWKLPERLRFPSKMRKRTRNLLNEFRLIEKKKKQVENEDGVSGHRRVPVYG